MKEFQYNNPNFAYGTARNPKQDKRSQKGFWAPGDYYNQCRDCGDMFIGDKRAIMCADCAYKMIKCQYPENSELSLMPCPNCGGKNVKEWGDDFDGDVGCQLPPNEFGGL